MGWLDLTTPYYSLIEAGYGPWLSPSQLKGRTQIMGEARRRIVEIAAQKITKELADQGLLIRAGWVGYKAMVVPLNASPEQIEETRWAFFAGAQHVFHSMLGALDADAEPTEADEKRMENLDKELTQFYEEFKLRYKTELGKA